MTVTTRLTPGPPPTMNTPDPVDILIADGVDHAFRQLSLALEQRVPALLIAMPGESTRRCWQIASGWAQAIGASSHDIDIPTLGGVEALKEAERQVPDNQVLILSRLHLAEDNERDAASRLASGRAMRGAPVVLSGRRDLTGAWTSERDDFVPTIRHASDDDDPRFPAPTELVLPPGPRPGSAPPEEEATS